MPCPTVARRAPCPQPVPGPHPATCQSGPGRSQGAPGPGEGVQTQGCRTGLGRAQGAGPWLLPTHPQNSPLPAHRPRHSPDSLLMSLAGSLGAAGTLRLALCSFQYSRQCRSWEWMKRHMSQAWAAHTSSSMQSLQRGRAGVRGAWAHRPWQGRRWGQEPGCSHHLVPAHPWPQHAIPHHHQKEHRAQCQSWLQHASGAGG